MRARLSTLLLALSLAHLSGAALAPAQTAVEVKPLAAWRQRDFDFVTGERFRGLLKEHDVRLVTWREIGRLVAKP